jgi:PPM family protein phosphatase
MSMSTPVRVIFAGDDEKADIELPAGSACVRSVRSPDKTTPNEDTAAIIEVDHEHVVLAVADGVGGVPGGAEASQIAIRSLAERVTMTSQSDALELRPLVLDALDHANAALLEIGRGSATTIAIAAMTGGRLRSYHVGDSEVVVVGQRGKVKLRVVPHSPTGFAVEAGMLDENAAVKHAERHLLLNVVGSQEMRIEVGMPLDLARHDTVLLATDGVLDNLYLDEIVELIRCGPLTKAADALVARARKRMHEPRADRPSKPDDLTVILFRRRR